jgi:Mg-chelatase subunit ChlD
MSSPSWSAETTRLVLAVGPGLVTGNLVAVSTADATQQAAGLFARGSGALEDRQAVRIVPVPELPARTVAVSDTLADDLGLRGDAPRWRLTEEPATQAVTVVLESMTEGKLSTLVGLLAKATDLAGQVFWLAEDGGAAWVHQDGTPFRVRSASGSKGAPLLGLVQISPDTEVQLVAPGNRTGVDIVILADCSGSMSWADIEQPGGPMSGSLPRFVRRIDALKRALGEMINIRAHTVGRVSRIALVSFTDRAQCVFPRLDGMAEINGMDDPSAVAAFQEAVNVLRYQDAGTDIGRALHFASELLYRHGVPDNDRLIVLVSDGAEWAPKSEDSIGEAVAAVSDPVSLMEELEQSMSIKLHAIGIGDEDSFQVWWDRYQRRAKGDPHVSIVPNHRLLTELVRVGGGDPRRVGGMEVLQEYFAGLGQGVTRRVGRPAPGALRQVQATFDALAEPLRDEEAGLASRRAALADRARQLRPDCVRLSVRCGAKPMYVKTDDDNLAKILRIGRPVRDEDEFRVWVTDLAQMFYELLESRLKESAPARPYDIPEVRELMWDGRMDQIRRLRNYANHASQKPEDEVAIARILMRFAGRKLIDRSDARQWTRVQVGLLDDLVSVLTDVRDTLERLPLPTQPAGIRAVPVIDGYR